MTGFTRGVTAAAFLIGVLSLTACPPAWAFQKTVKSKTFTYPHSPVQATRSRVRFVETFYSPTQVALPGARTQGSRIRYANRAGLSPSSFVLSGEVDCHNVSRRTIEAFALTIIALDAFHQPLRLPGEPGPYAVEQVVTTIVRGASKRVTWERRLPTGNVFEVAVVITRVRFADGSVWLAPREELLDIF